MIKKTKKRTIQTNGKKRVLAEHFAKTRQELLSYADHIGIAKHGDIKGLAREGVIRIFLEENLPKLLEFKTGEILGRNDERSGQLDIIFQSIAAPRIPLFENVQITLVDATLGVLEVKSNLTVASWDKPSHLRSALETFQKVKRIKRDARSHILSPLREGIVLEKTPCFLIAYKGPTISTLEKYLIDYGQARKLPIKDYGPDVICILDKGYSFFRDDGWIVPRNWVYAPKQVRAASGYYLWSKDRECLACLFLYLCRILESAAIQPIDFLKYFY
jgi:hypothetical protein